ncbi:MAG TPA: ATP-binding protein, partial [Pyrinomonadaceae bacterium]|nr:ATP-binding protein [Pyrinomonadaceae bacterium]
IVFIVGSLAPVLLVGGLFYRNSLRAVEGMLREEVETKTARIAADVEASLRERELELNQLAQDDAVRASVRDASTSSPQTPADTKNDARIASDDAPVASPAKPPQGSPQAAVSDFISRHRDYYSSITIVAAPQDGRPPVRIETPTGSDPAPRVKTGDLLLPGQLRLDERIWAASDQRPLRSDVTSAATGTPCIAYTVPVFSAEHEGAPRLALVAELKLDALLQKAGSDLNAATATASAPAAPAFAMRESHAGKSARLLVVLDGAGQVVYHTNHALKYQPVSSAMPYFEPLARAMRAGAGGADFYTVPADGSRWFAAFKPVAGSNLSVAVAGNYTRAVAGLSQSALVVLGLSLLVAAAAALLLYVIATRAARRIERVTEAAATIASTGDLNQRIEVQANDETHALAEGFNQMSDRLRELIARESEMRQFQSFVRLSAMLTHDLKNSITGLSMLVTNMERQFHRAEFREDAITSLKQATEKLGSIVARLSEPVRTLSGEYRRTPQPADLIPVIRRVMTASAEPSAAFYDIRTELPDTLYALIDPERIERVVENLIVNALEAMGGRGGRLTVTAGEEAKGLVFFSVEDSGPGMTEDFMRTRLFRAFATTKKRGIGLGLYTCREIVESHGGRLEVKSKLGSGTRFRVVLPSISLMASHARSFEKPPQGQAATAKKKTGTTAS